MALITSGADDVTVQNGTFSATGTSLLLGMLPAGMNLVGVRFPSVRLPRGVTLEYAHLRVWSKDNTSVAAQFDIVGHNHSNSPAFTSTSHPGTRSQTNTRITVSGLPTWAANTMYELPDIKAILHEISARSDWAEGNAMSFFLIGSGTPELNRAIHSYESNTNYAVSLHGCYLVESSGGPGPLGSGARFI